MQFYYYRFSKIFAKINVLGVFIIIAFIIFSLIFTYLSSDYIYSMDNLQANLDVAIIIFEAAHALLLDEAMELIWIYGGSDNSSLSPLLLERKLYLEK